MIAGGFNEELLSDAYVFDIHLLQTRTVILMGELNFGYRGSAVNTEEGTVMAVVHESNENTHLVRYRNNVITVIKSI